MKFYITYFYNVRFLKPNQIPVSTAQWDPVWFHDNSHNQNRYFIDKNGIMNGIKEDLLVLPLKTYNQLDEQCARHCIYADKAPNCKFMIAYSQHLDSIDFDVLMKEFKNVAEDVRKITHYEGESEIVLLVHEKPTCKCAERPCLVNFFAKHNIDLKELTYETETTLYE